MELATPQHEIYEKLNQLGWQLDKVQFRGGYYWAKAKSAQTSQEIERKGNSPEMAVAAVYQHAIRATDVRQRSIVGAWQTDWYDKLHEIAKEYADLPQFEDRAVEAWQSLAAESKAQATIIRKQIDVELTPEFQPYDKPDEMRKDVNTKSHLFVPSGESHHPVWDTATVIDFRICHDVLGICQTGGGWSWPGANKAVLNHMPNLSEEAQEALFVEVIGRTAYETVYRGLGGPKVALMTDFLDQVREAEGKEVQVPKVGTHKKADVWNVKGTFYGVLSYLVMLNGEIYMGNIWESHPEVWESHTGEQIFDFETGDYLLDWNNRDHPYFTGAQGNISFEVDSQGQILAINNGAKPGGIEVEDAKVIPLATQVIQRWIDDGMDTTYQKMGKVSMPYHVAPGSKREQIEREGIQPQEVSHAGTPQDPDGVYYWDTPEQAEFFRRNYLPWKEQGYDTWYFDLEPGEEPEPDAWFDMFPPNVMPDLWNPDGTPGAHVLPHGVSPDRLKRIGSPYHIAPRSVREKIEQEGLKGPSPQDHEYPFPKGIYYWQDRGSAETYPDAIDWDDLHPDDPYDIWYFELTPEEQAQATEDPWLYDVMATPSGEPDGYYLPGATVIPPDRLKRISSPAVMEPPSQTIAPPQFDFDNWSVLDKDPNEERAWWGYLWGNLFSPDVWGDEYFFSRPGTWYDAQTFLLTKFSRGSNLGKAVENAAPNNEFRYKLGPYDSHGDTIDIVIELVPE